MMYVPNPRERESHYQSKKRRSRPWRSLKSKKVKELGEESLREEQRR
jgi:hypothetical protein